MNPVVIGNATLPKFITFTGVDEWTDWRGLNALSRAYPIEWGVLFSPKRQGKEPRYPRISFIRELFNSPMNPMRWSAHLCGGDARTVIESGESTHSWLLRNFERSQINTADPKVQPGLIARWACREGLRAILQCRGSFPAISSVDVLFDTSGGRGQLPSDWPAPTDTTFCGYAGGLNPDNVAAAVAAIGEHAADYWIDMETGVRDVQDRFDLDKCRAVCEAVYGKAPAA